MHTSDQEGSTLVELDTGCQKHFDSEVQSAHGLPQPRTGLEVDVGLLTGGQDRHYAFGLAMALISRGVCLDVIGSDEVDSPELHGTPRVNFLNLRGNQRPASFVRKAFRVLSYYVRLIRYAAVARPKVFHILWNNKFELFDRTLLILYYKCLGKKIVFTAHNVNVGTRDSADTLLNRLTLRIQYRFADHIFVHTEKMKREVIEGFGIRKAAVTVIPYGINNAVPETELTPGEAKRRLHIRAGEKTILFFGRIAPYKGLEYLIAAFQSVVVKCGSYRLIVAGRPEGGCVQYVNDIQQMISRGVHPERIMLKMDHIADQETELYFKAADVLVLPYKHIFQSGVLFLGYSFGLPVIAADVGSLREDIIEGKTGFVFRPRDPVDLAKTIETYFASDLYRCLNSRRQEIRDHVRKQHSWDVVGQMTQNIYAELLRN